MEKVHCIGLQHLSVVHQPSDFFSCRRQFVHASDNIHGLGSAEMMADWADAAKPLNDDRHFPVHPSLNEPFKSPELHDMKSRLFDLAGLVEPDRNLAMAFYTGDGINDDLSRRSVDLNIGHYNTRPLALRITRTCIEGKGAPAPCP